MHCIKLSKINIAAPSPNRTAANAPDNKLYFVKSLTLTLTSCKPLMTSLWTWLRLQYMKNKKKFTLVVKHCDVIRKWFVLNNLEIKCTAHLEDLT